MGVETIAIEAKANFSTTPILMAGGPTLGSPSSLALIVWAASTQALIAINSCRHHRMRPAAVHIKEYSHEHFVKQFLCSIWVGVLQTC